jgi:hypothetical protein
MSASDITDSIITNLTAASVFGACQVKTHYHVLESSGCCAVVSFAGVDVTPFTMGDSFQRVYTHAIEVYVKDTSGNAEQIEAQTQRMVDLSVCSLQADSTLQRGDPNLRQVEAIRGAHDIQTVANAAGAVWYLAELEIEVRELPADCG